MSSNLMVERKLLLRILQKQTNKKKHVATVALALNSASKIYCFHCKRNWFLNLLGTRV